MQDKGRIYITGDCHASFHKFNTDRFPEQKELTRDDVVIVCGDFGGIWCDTSDERHWLKWLNEKNFTTLFVDGNHENFDRLISEFEVVDYCGGKAHKIRDNIYHLMRGYVFNICGKKIFAFGGASSHDIVKNVLKSKISEITSGYSMMDIYSGSRSEINKKLTEYLNEEFIKSYGVEVISASIIDVHPDEQLQKTIQDRVTALQKKQQAEAEQETIKVEAETKKIQAQAEADAMLIAAQAEADAYRIKSAEITDNLLRKWELDARMQHGWVTIQGANTVVTGQ